MPGNSTRLQIRRTGRAWSHRPTWKKATTRFILADTVSPCLYRGCGSYKNLNADNHSRGSCRVNVCKPKPNQGESGIELQKRGAIWEPVAYSTKPGVWKSYFPSYRISIRGMLSLWLFLNIKMLICGGYDDRRWLGNIALHVNWMIKPE